MMRLNQSNGPIQDVWVFTETFICFCPGVESNCCILCSYSQHRQLYSNDPLNLMLALVLLNLSTGGALFICWYLGEMSENLQNIKTFSSSSFSAVTSYSLSMSWAVIIYVNRSVHPSSFILSLSVCSSFLLEEIYLYLEQIWYFWISVI